MNGPRPIHKNLDTPHHAEGPEPGRCPPGVQMAAILCEAPEHSGVERLVEVAAARYGVPEPVTQQLLATAQQRAAELATLFNA